MEEKMITEEKYWTDKCKMRKKENTVRLMERRRHEGKRERR